MKSFKSILIPLMAILSEGLATLEPPSPKISVYRQGKDWKHILPHDSATSTSSNGLILYSEKGDDLFLRCTASYPIQWKFTGLLSPPEMVQIQPPKRNITRNIFEITVIIFFQDAKNFADLGASVQISCEKIGESGIMEAVFVYVMGNDNNLFVQSTTNIVTESKLIPCAIKEPTVIPELYQQTSNGTELLVRDATLRYVPTHGFYSDAEFSGTYTCRLDTSSMTIKAVTLSPSIADDIHFSPKVDLIRVFSEDTIQFECYSKSGRATKLVADKSHVPSNLMNIYYLHNDYGGMTASVCVNFGNNTRISSVMERIICMADDENGNPVILKQWSVEFLRTPELYMDNYRGEVHCLSRGSPKTLQTLRCRNSMDCNFMVGQDCIQNANQCNFKKQKQFYEKSDSYCWLNKYGHTRSCVSVPYSHLNGVAECYVDGLVKRWEYFVSLDFLKYSNWRDAPTSQLIRMDEVNPILYTNETSTFFCMSVAFLFADSISFELELSDGERMHLEGSGPFWNTSIASDENPRKIDELNIIGTLEINLPLNATGVHCLAPWWNATDNGLTTERKFETRHLMEPQLRHSNHNGSQNKEEFFLDEKNQRLTCFAVGEPQPKYTWYFENMTVSEMFPELKTSIGSDGEGYLEFPETMSSRYNGEYRCSARNKVGTVDRTFHVTVSSERKTTNRNPLYWAMALIMLVLAFVAILLVVFVRKYKKAKKIVRSLTDYEINEFFEGKPELLAKRRESISNDYTNSNVEIADFMPYNKELEIPLDDLEFDSSSNSFLGSGAFSFVVRGKIISTSKPVAVKISKPTADVTMFKSLLSEVKMMTFVGEHENVVALIGVCTQDIRNRSIHIATDVCELGSLDGFLRKCRPSFVDLVNENHQIDLTFSEPLSSFSSFGDEPPSVSTLDLIHFSAQIAKGMEYLSWKCVIHGDLAARNVLLTKDRIAKISDFGLSRKLYGDMNYVKKSNTPVPWRWLAVESLTTLTFSTCSDVWAFGVTLFEIFTLGNVPFPNENYDNDFITRLSGGMRMGRPEYSTPEIYYKMAACWEKEPEHRPNFSNIRSFFDELVRKYGFNMTDTNESATNQCDARVQYVDVEHLNATSDQDRNMADKAFEHGTISEAMDKQEDVFIKQISSRPSYVSLG